MGGYQNLKYKIGRIIHFLFTQYDERGISKSWAFYIIIIIIIIIFFFFYRSKKKKKRKGIVVNRS